MRKYHVRNLRTTVAPTEGLQGGRGAARVGEVDKDTLHEVFGAPWRGIELIQLSVGSSLGPRELDDSETVLFVTSGTGLARFDGGDIELHEGLGLALMKGSVLHVENTAKDGPLELFLAEMAVPLVAAQ